MASTNEHNADTPTADADDDGAVGKQRVVIFDTTLRDGEQSPGASLNVEQKHDIALQLVALGVDVIEAGFPITSPGDFEAVKTVAAAVKDSAAVCALARCIPKDIEAAAGALETASKPRIHVFLATSEIHRKYKLRKAQDEIVRLAIDGVKRARDFCADVEFSPEDASRTESAFLVEVVQAAIEAGARTINIPDTVGYAIPAQFAELIACLRENVSNIDGAVLSVHCHNDLGLAVANSLAAVSAGARQVECTINGLGERAGNCSLEELVMTLRTRRDFFGLATGINTTRLYPTSRMVSSLTGMYVQRNKAIVGRNAFAHEAGIHQDGILKERTTYEIMRPQDVGFARTEMVLGKHSGRHAFRSHVGELGYQLTDEQVDKAFAEFKVLADKKKDVYDDDIMAILDDLISGVPEQFHLERFHIASGTHDTPTAEVTLRTPGGDLVEQSATGDGPVDAIYKTIDRITGLSGNLADYAVRAVTRGKDALGEVSIEVDFGQDVVRGRAASTDILEASARAYLNATNFALGRLSAHDG